MIILSRNTPLIYSIKICSKMLSLSKHSELRDKYRSEFNLTARLQNYSEFIVQLIICKQSRDLSQVRLNAAIFQVLYTNCKLSGDMSFYAQLEIMAKNACVAVMTQNIISLLIYLSRRTPRRSYTKFKAQSWSEYYDDHEF